MPDLSHDAVHAFWHDYDSRILYRIICMMEGVEFWTVDHEPEIDAAFKQLGLLFDKVDSPELQLHDQFIKMLVSTKAGRALRFMQYLDVLKPGTASKLLVYAEDKLKDANTPQEMRPYYDLFLKRNLAFERLQLLGRVLAPERINLVLRALETSDE